VRQDWPGGTEAASARSSVAVMGGSVGGAGVPLGETGRVPLVLAGAPIGSADDASPRLVASLASADLVAAEDTRRLHRLCSDLGVELRGRVVSYFEGNEVQRTPQLLEALRAGERVVLVTDAGMPTVSDPGYRLVAAAAAEDLPVTCVPGPSAVTTALAVSGLPTDRFCFEGFLPRMAAVLGPTRRAVVCRELTKTYEEVVRGTLPELVAWASGGVRGEVTLVLEGAEERQEELTPAELVRLVGVREAAGLTRKEALAAVASETGLPKRDVYDAVVAAKSPKAEPPDTSAR
jgi:16S rRNA (cytidine1402-2'-O)-methyltransferase